jgi:CheY-like chemotaxis protein
VRNEDCQRIRDKDHVLFRVSLAHTDIAVPPNPNLISRRSLDTQHSNNFLVVEDDPNDAFLIHRALTTAKCGASFVCRNPSETKSFLLGVGMYADRQRFPLPKVVLTDLRIGAESGLELVAWIRKQESPLRETKIVILTDSPSQLQWDAAINEGAQRVYQKPNRLADLQAILVAIAAEFCSGDAGRSK